MVPLKLLNATIGCIKRLDVYVKDILDPHYSPTHVYHDDQAPITVVNHKGEPWRALPTLVSFSRSYALKDNGPGLVWNFLTKEMVEPNTDEWKRAMGFRTGVTHISNIMEFQRWHLIGQAMDLNCLF